MPTYRIGQGDLRSSSLRITRAERSEVFGDARSNVITIAPRTIQGDLCDVIDGGAGNDVITAASTDDVLLGGTGNDTIRAGAGNDDVDGGADDDIVDGGDGNDIVRGGSGNDTLDAGDGNDTALGGDGADTLLGGNGDDTLDGGAGNDTLIGSFGRDRIFGGDGDDLLDGGAVDSAFGVPDPLIDDELDGGAGNDTVLGGTGNDILRGGAGNDLLVGSSGNDQLFGDEGVDELLAGEGDDTADGGAGDDTIRGLGGDDILRGGADNDLVEGNEGSDQLFGDAGNDILRSGAGRIVTDPVTGATSIAEEIVDGGEGNDTADYSGSSSAIGIDLRGDATGAVIGVGGHAQNDRLISIETIIASNFNDTLIGNDAANRLEGGAGADTIDGQGGDDILVGGAGAIDPATGVTTAGDLLIGNGGLDTADYRTSTAAVTIQLNGSVGNEAAEGQGTGGDAELDRLVLIERIIGSNFDDTLRGDVLANIFDGAGGADTIDGAAGTDTVEYVSATAGVAIDLTAIDPVTGAVIGPGGDRLSNIERYVGSSFADTFVGSAAAGDFFDGGAGDDTFRGNAGADVFLGGAGSDTADYSNAPLATGTLTTGIIVGVATSGGVEVGFSGFGTAQAAPVSDASGDTLLDVENIVRSAFNDQILAGLANIANRLDGGAGNDLLRGGGGADTLIGGAGTDTASYSNSDVGVQVSLLVPGPQVSAGHAAGDVLSQIENLTGSAFADLLVGDAGTNQLSGGSGDDSLVGGAGGDVLIGGAGVDTADYSTATTAVRILAATINGQPGFIGQANASGPASDATGDQLLEIENVIGSGFDDLLAGNAANNRLRGGAGADIVDGGAGIDTADYTGSTAGVQITLSATGAVTGLGGHAQGDTIVNIENLIGSSFTDVLNGSAGNNELRSGTSNASGEVLRGGSGADVLIANGTTVGTRTLIGEGLTDLGSAGVDTFVSLAGFNIISGYQLGETIILDEATTTRSLVQSGTTYFFRLDTDAIAGNGGATTETWVALGTELAAAQTLAGQINAFVVVDPAFIA